MLSESLTLYTIHHDTGMRRKWNRLDMDTRRFVLSNADENITYKILGKLVRQYKRELKKGEASLS